MPPRVEHEEDAQCPVLGARQLLHVVVAGRADALDHRPPERRSSVRHQVHSFGDAVLLVRREARSPVPELVGVLDFPHPHTMSDFS